MNAERLIAVPLVVGLLGGLSCVLTAVVGELTTSVFVSAVVLAGVASVVAAWPTVSGRAGWAHHGARAESYAEAEESRERDD